MKFALLGEDRAAQSLVRAVLRSGDHELVLAAAAGSFAVELVANSPRLVVSDQAADVLVTPEVEAAIVCGAYADVLETAKRLAADGTPLIVVPNARQELTAIYELSLVRDDSHVQLVPYASRVFDPEIAVLRRLLQANDSRAGGAWWRVERTVPQPRLAPIDAAVPLLDDVLVLQSLGGTFDRVTALRTGEEGERFTASTVTLAGETGPEVTWTIRAGSEASWRLVVDADESSAVQRDARWALGDAAADEALAHVVRALDGADAASVPTWTAMVRAFEVVDAARRSVKRRRTIDLLFETTSEQNQFKSQMAAGGCAMLMYVLFVSVLLASTGTLGEGRSLLRGILPWLLLLPVVVFLGLQLLYFVARPTGGDSISGDTAAPPKGD